MKTVYEKALEAGLSEDDACGAMVSDAPDCVTFRNILKRCKDAEQNAINEIDTCDEVWVKILGVEFKVGEVERSAIKDVVYKMCVDSIQAIEPTITIDTSDETGEEIRIVTIEV